MKPLQKILLILFTILIFGNFVSAIGALNEEHLFNGCGIMIFSIYYALLFKQKPNWFIFGDDPNYSESHANSQTV